MPAEPWSKAMRSGPLAGILTVLGLGLVLVANPVKSAPTPPVQGVPVKLMRCCVQTSRTDATGTVQFLSLAQQTYTVLVRSPVAARVRTVARKPGCCTGSSSYFNVAANVEGQGDQSATTIVSGIEVEVTANGAPVAGAEVRLVQCCVPTKITDAAGSATFTGIPAGQWALETTHAAPVHLEVGGVNVSPVAFNAMSGVRGSGQVTVTGPTSIIVRASQFTPPILVRRTPDTRLQPIKPPASKN